MRTTVNLTDDVAAAVAQVHSKRSIGMSQAINELIRAGLTADEGRARHFAQKSQTSDADGRHELGEALDDAGRLIQPLIDTINANLLDAVERSAEQHERVEAWLRLSSTGHGSGIKWQSMLGVSAHLHASAACIRATADALNRVGWWARTGWALQQRGLRNLARRTAESGCAAR